MKFSKQDLQDLAYGGVIDGFELVEEELVDTSRWSNHYNQIFTYGGKFYSTNYSVGATECQDESPYEYEPDEIECQEVVPVEKTITVYKAVTE